MPTNIIDSIQLSGVTYTLQGSGGGTVDQTIISGSTNAVAGGAVYDKFDEVEQVTARALNDLDEKINPTVELTQAQYDALVSAGTVSADTYYIITDATPVDVSQYWTSAQTQSAINQATSGKVNTSSVVSSVTSASTDSQIPTAKAVWEAASGGGTTYTAGRGIDITNDTISVSLPISAGTGSNSIQEGQNTKATGSNSHAEGSSTSATSQYSHAEGWGTIANGYNGSHAEGRITKATGSNSHAEGSGTESYGQISHAEGYCTIARGSGAHAEGWYTTTRNDFAHAEGNYTSAMTEASHAEGNYTKTTNKYEHASGSYNNTVSASTTFGDSGNTLFSVGNGTANNARHNAFEIRQNGDIYLSSGGTDIKLQDYLGGGSITVDTALDSASTNPVENRVIYNKIDEVETVTARALNDLNEKKQDTLSAGTGISISGNVISATGGGGGGTVDSAITSGSTNAVQSSAIWSATTYNKDVTIEFDSNRYSTNFPSGCTTVKVEASNMSYSKIVFYSDDFDIGRYDIDFFIKKVTNNFTDSTYEISGNTVIITYPSSKNVNRLAKTSSNGNQTVKAVVEGAWVNENTYMKSEVDGKVSTLQNNINAKLDSTAYTPTVVDSTLTKDSTNPVQNQALYDELRIVTGKEPDTVITWNSKRSTNFPSGCTKIEVDTTNLPQYNDTRIQFNKSNGILGIYRISKFTSIIVSNDFTDSTYSISGSVVTIEWPSSKGVVGLEYNGTESPVTAIGSDTIISVKQAIPTTTSAITSGSTDVITSGAVYDKIDEIEQVTAAGLNALNDNFGGLKLVKLTQAEYNALATKDSSTLYIIVN